MCAKIMEYVFQLFQLIELNCILKPRFACKCWQEGVMEHVSRNVPGISLTEKKENKPEGDHLDYLRYSL